MLTVPLRAYCVRAVMPELYAPSDSDRPLRVFFALALAPELRNEVAHLARRVAKQCFGRPVPGDNLHLTLAFVGALERSRLAAAMEAGSTVRGEPMTVCLDRVGGFRRAAVAWIGVSAPPPALAALATDVARALAGAGVGFDERVFHPHVTIARHCRVAPEPGPAGPWRWRIDEIVLFESPVGAGGSRYRALASWPLASAASIPGAHP